MQQVAKLVIEVFLSRMNRDALKTPEAGGNFMDFDDYNYQMLNKKLFKNHECNVIYGFISNPGAT